MAGATYAEAPSAPSPARFADAVRSLYRPQRTGELQLAPRLEELELGLTSGFVREALNRAVGGVGPLTPVAKAAERQMPRPDI